MSEWHKTACNLCYVNCALEVQTDGRTITRIRGDKENPRTAGYLCQKPQRLTWYGDHDDRLTTPLRRRADGTHEPISWETALSEIAARLQDVRDEDLAQGRPGSFAYVGGGGQGNHSGGGYGHALLRWMNSTRFFGALSQEKTGDFWVNGKLYGGQTCHTSEGVEDCDLLVVIGCNPWLANGFNRARNVVNTIKNDPDRKMIVLDPRRTETAAVADVHLPLRPGTDAYLLGAVLALIVERQGTDERVPRCAHRGLRRGRGRAGEVPGGRLDRARGGRPRRRRARGGPDPRRAGDDGPRGAGDPAGPQLHAQQLPGEAAVPGHRATSAGRAPTRCTPGSSRCGASRAASGRRSPGSSTSAGCCRPPRSPRRSSPTIRTGPGCCGSSRRTRPTPRRHRDDERAIRECELSVVIDVAYTETAALADYVLPAASQYEKWECTFFDFEWPTNYFHLRRPLFEPLPGTLVEAEIYARLFDELGVLPDSPTLDRLTEIARTDRPTPARASGAAAAEYPWPSRRCCSTARSGATLPDGAASAAALWPGCHPAARRMPVPVQRALGTD